jgi:hypothetical protein
MIGDRAAEGRENGYEETPQYAPSRRSPRSDYQQRKRKHIPISTCDRVSYAAKNTTQYLNAQRLIFETFILPSFAPQPSSEPRPLYRLLFDNCIPLLHPSRFQEDPHQPQLICLILSALWIDLPQPCSKRQENRCAELCINFPRNTNRNPPTSLLSSNGWSAELQFQF